MDEVRPPPLESECGIGFRAGPDLRLLLPHGSVLRTDAPAPHSGLVCRADLARTAAHGRRLGSRPTGRGYGDRDPLGPRPGGARLLHRTHRRRLGGDLGHTAGRRPPSVGPGPAGPGLTRRFAPDGGCQVGCGRGPDGWGQRHRRALHTAPRRHLVDHPVSGSAPSGAVRLVGRLGRSGVFLVGRPHDPPGQVRLQLPALHRDRSDDHGDGIGLRGRPRRLLLAELLRPGRATCSRWVDDRDVGFRHPGDGTGGGARTGRTGSPDPGAALPGGQPRRRGSGHRQRVLRPVRRTRERHDRAVAHHDSGAAPEHLEVLGRCRAAVGARSRLVRLLGAASDLRRTGAPLAGQTLDQTGCRRSRRPRRRGGIHALLVG